MELLEDKVIELLKNIGYEYSEDDYSLLVFCIDKVVSELNSRCHVRNFQRDCLNQPVKECAVNFCICLKQQVSLKNLT